MRCPLASITVPSGGGSSLNVDPACFVDNNTSVVNRGFPFNGAGLPKLEGVTWVENAYQLLDEKGGSTWTARPAASTACRAQVRTSAPRTWNFPSWRSWWTRAAPRGT